MEIIRQRIPGVAIIIPGFNRDEHAYECTLWDNATFRRAGILNATENFVSDREYHAHEEAFSGFHFQTPPFAQAKLIHIRQYYFGCD
jgi:hypothetical protein